jgi:hypothetical protein
VPVQLEQEPSIPEATVLAALSREEGKTMVEIMSNLDCRNCTGTVLGLLLRALADRKVVREGDKVEARLSLKELRRTLLK